MINITCTWSIIFNIFQVSSKRIPGQCRGLIGVFFPVLKFIFAVVVLPSSSQGFGFVFWTYISLEIDHKNLNTQRFSKEPQERSIAKVRGRLWPLKGTVSSPELWQFLAFRNNVGVKCRQLTPIIWKCLSLIPGQCRSSIKLIFPGLKFEFFRISQ